MTVTMLPSAGEYANHKGERFETDGTVHNICGTECYLLRGYGLFAIDQLEVVDDGTGGTEACHFKTVEWFIDGEEGRCDICECDRCGYRCARGFITDEHIRRCPKCKAKVVPE